MKKAFILFLLIFCINLAKAEGNYSLVGYWKTSTDATNTPRSLIQITEENGSFAGKIVKLFTDKAEKPKQLCERCQGELHNKPIIGLTVLSNLKPHGKSWEEGSILDPDNGKLYHCKAYLIDNGKKLHLRGYWGIPLFGRTQIWERVEYK